MIDNAQYTRRSPKSRIKSLEVVHYHTEGRRPGIYFEREGVRFPAVVTPDCRILYATIFGNNVDVVVLRRYALTPRNITRLLSVINSPRLVPGESPH